MGEYNSILALKLQQQQVREQQAREDSMRADATVQASIQQLVQGQQRLADQQIKQDKVALDMAKVQYVHETNREKLRFERQRLAVEYQWKQQVERAQMEKDVASKEYTIARTKHPTRYQSNTYLQSQDFRNLQQNRQNAGEYAKTTRRTMERRLKRIRNLQAKGPRDRAAMKMLETLTKTRDSAQQEAYIQALENNISSVGAIEGGIGAMTSYSDIEGARRDIGGFSGGYHGASLEGQGGGGDEQRQRILDALRQQKQQKQGE